MSGDDIISNDVDYGANAYGVYSPVEFKESNDSIIPSSSTTSSIQTTTTTWNERFQTSLSMPETTEAEIYSKFLRLSHLSLDFIEVAKMYGATIISEHFSKKEDRTIPVRNIGGVLGGTKFIVGGILFKLAEDTQHGNTYLFGGKSSNTELANKASGHELRGAISYFQFHNIGIHIPLQAVVDYRGFRMVAMPILPINNDTIIYGSSDKGATMHVKDDEFIEKMKTAAKVLHIAEHGACKSDTKIYSAGDCEGHAGLDKRFYLLDLSRSAPPENPNVEHLEAQTQSIFYRLLRPELLLILKHKNVEPLSPDAFSGWSSGCSDSKKHMKLVEEATTFMLTTQIDCIIEELYENMKTSELIERLKQQHSLSTILHQYGVNVRHFGLLRHKIQQQQEKSKRKSTFVIITKVILIEMVARSVKNMLRDVCRKEMHKQQDSEYASDFLYRAKCVYVLNMITGVFWEANASHFWNTIVLNIRARFGHVSISVGMDGESLYNQLFLQNNEKQKKMIINGNDIMYYVLMVALNSIGMELTSTCTKTLKDQSVRFEFVGADLKADSPVVKFLPIIDTAEGSLLLKQLDLRAKIKSIEDKNNRSKYLSVRSRLLALATTKFLNASKRDTSRMLYHVYHITRLRQFSTDYEIQKQYSNADSMQLNALQYIRVQHMGEQLNNSILLNVDMNKMYSSIVYDIIYTWSTRENTDLQKKFGGASSKECVRRLFEYTRLMNDSLNEDVKQRLKEFVSSVPYDLGGDCFRCGVIWLKNTENESENFQISNKSRIQYEDQTLRKSKFYVDFDWLYTFDNNNNNNDNDDDDEEEEEKDDDDESVFNRMHNDLQRFLPSSLMNTKHDEAIALFGGPYMIHRKILQRLLYLKCNRLQFDRENTMIMMKMYEISPENHIISLLNIKVPDKSLSNNFKPSKTDTESVVFARIPYIKVNAANEIMKIYKNGWDFFRNSKKNTRQAEDSHVIIELSVVVGMSMTKSQSEPPVRRTMMKRSKKSTPSRPQPKRTKKKKNEEIVCRFISLARYRRVPSVNKALSNIVSCLTARMQGNVIGFRNSLLTRLLKSSLTTTSGGKLVMYSILDDNDNDDFNLFRLNYLNACVGAEEASFL